MEYNSLLDNEIDEPSCHLSNPLIMGGTVARPQEHPHFALVGWEINGKIDFKCGGTLISDRFIISAAHCLMHHGRSPTIIRLGEYDLRRTDDSNHKDFRISSIVKHPDYRFYNDIALIELNETVKFTKEIRPACLWSQDNFGVNKAVAIGYGYTNYMSDTSNILQEVTLDIINRNICTKLVSRGRKLKDGLIDTQICAGVLKGGKDTCPGDSGGPLQITLRNQPCIKYIIGVTSLGRMCGISNSPGIYTRISKYIDWIEEIVWN